MLRPILLVSVLLTLTGCATADKQAVLQNLQGCERHYVGTVSGGIVGAGFTGSVKIDCPHGEGVIPAPPN